MNILSGNRFFLKWPKLIWDKFQNFSKNVIFWSKMNVLTWNGHWTQFLVILHPFGPNCHFDSENHTFHIQGSWRTVRSKFWNVEYWNFHDVSKFFYVDFRSKLSFYWAIIFSGRATDFYSLYETDTDSMKLYILVKS